MLFIEYPFQNHSPKIIYSIDNVLFNYDAILTKESNSKQAITTTSIAYNGKMENDKQKYFTANVATHSLIIAPMNHRKNL